LQEHTLNQQVDFIVVGATAAGCILANPLSEDPQTTVCLIEARPEDNSPFIHIPAGFIRVGHDPNYTWDFQTAPNEQTMQRRVITRMGRVLGGSSSINGFNYTRGIASDFDGWEQLGNTGWSYAKVLPYFKRSEQRIGKHDPMYRGTHGLLPITDCDWRHPLCDAFIKGASEFGLPAHVDYNGPSQRGAGYYQRWIHKGRRISAAQAFLKPARRRPNLQVLTRTQVLAICFEGKMATGVKYRHPDSNEVCVIGARREVILSAGAGNTPKLLQLSGVGPPHLLKAFGIEPVCPSNGVGENFQDHFMVRSVVRVKGIKTLNTMARGLPLLGQVARWFTGKPSILGVSPSVCFAFERSSPDIEHPDLQFHFSPGSYAAGIAGKLDDFEGMTLGVYQTRPNSRGFVRIQSPDPNHLPLIQPNYLADSGDQRVTVKALRLARSYLHSKALSPYIERDDFPAASDVTDEALLTCARERGGTAWHFTGTCRMGPDDDPGAVVDACLRVRGIQNLRVVDASIMPTMPSGNTGAPTMMIAEKAADMILGKTPLPAVSFE
jgi:choline dehydrogenase